MNSLKPIEKKPNWKLYLHASRKKHGERKNTVTMDSSGIWSKDMHIDRQYDEDRHIISSRCKKKKLSHRCATCVYISLFNSPPEHISDCQNSMFIH